VKREVRPCKFWEQDYEGNGKNSQPMTDYEEISIIVGQLRGLLSRAHNMTKNGLDLSKQKISSAVEDGVYKEFIRIIEKAKEVNDSNGFGQHGTLLSLANSEIGNWSELIDKCIILIPIVEGFERRLRPGVPGVEGGDI